MSVATRSLLESLAGAIEIADDVTPEPASKAIQGVTVFGKLRRRCCAEAGG